MKAVVAEKQQGEWKLVDKPVPEPGQGQVRVKSMFIALNPVDGFMLGTGNMVTEWPFVLGCDASGVVDKCGPGVSNLKEGDRVAGCSRLGYPSFSTCQEYHLMDAHLLLKNPANLSFEQAATLGVGCYTASLGLFDGLDVEIPNTKSLPAPKDEWILILGGSTSVGKFAVQLAKTCGYKVIGSASDSSSSVVRDHGADDILNYKLSEKEQVDYIMKATGGRIKRAFDTTAKNDNIARSLFTQLPDEQRLFATTGFAGLDPPLGNVKSYMIALGVIGRPDSKEVNKNVASYLPMLSDLLVMGKLRPSDYIVAADNIEKAPEAFEFQQSGKGGPKKVLVKIAS